MKRNLPTKKNSGMTLLEVIIAVSIFAIAATILLQGFVTSGRINKKSNLYLEATSTAQNIMEEIKAKDFEEVALAFNYPIDTTSDVAGRVRLSFLQPQIDRIRSGELGIEEKIMAKTTNGPKYDKVALYKDSYGDDESKVTASIISKDYGKTYKFNPRQQAGANQSKYYFVLENVNNNHETFDALIEFNGGEGSGYKKKASGNDEEGKNDYPAPNIAKLDSKTDAFYILEKNWNDMDIVQKAMQDIVNEHYNAANERWSENRDNALPDKDEEGYDELRKQYETEHPAPEKLDPEEVYKETKRTCYLKLEEENGVIKVKAKFTFCAFNYEKDGGNEYETMNFCPCNGKGEEGQTIHEGCFCTEKSSYSTIYISETEESLKNLFLFYYPNYNIRSVGNPFDKFVLDNRINYPLNFYVIKQRDDLLDIPSSRQEDDYSTEILIDEYPNDPNSNDVNWSANRSLFRAKTKLRTNINYDISGVNDILDRRKVDNQLQLTYRSVDPTDNNERGREIGYPAKKIVDLNGLEDRKQIDRIYTAKVGIYKAGAAEKHFPDSELIVSLDGAKEN